MWSSWGCSAVAGLLGALSASSAKCALGADYLRSLCEVAVGERADICEGVHLILRLGCAGLVFLCNAIMWTFFAKALRYSSSTAAATVTTTASNFVSSTVEFVPLPTADVSGSVLCCLEFPSQYGLPAVPQYVYHLL
ncbi:transmembrane protein 42 isoform X2 [Hyla sarda]|uniref:transmembrane protein 42 isoform X2 n=1 Tax=Hyla sarda TaxID=327740 RepID=UPI0024C2FAAA|nr:transmembrane protein 42 isoform X2 [Hyla sarda]